MPGYDDTRTDDGSHNSHDEPDNPLAPDNDSLWHVIATVIERTIQEHSLSPEAVLAHLQGDLEVMIQTQFDRIDAAVRRALARRPALSAYIQGSNYVLVQINGRTVNVLQSWLDGRYVQAAVYVLRLEAANPPSGPESDREAFFSFIQE